MAQGDRRVGSLSFKSDGTTYSVLSVWESAQYPGSYSINRDKGTEQYPPISLIDALKSWVLGKGYLNWRMAQQQAEREERPARRVEPRRARIRQEDVDPDPFNGYGDDDIPF